MPSSTADLAILITAKDQASPEVKRAGINIQQTAQIVGKSMMGLGVATMGTISIINRISPALGETLKPLMVVAQAMTVLGTLMNFVSSAAGVKLIATLGRITTALYAYAAANLVAAKASIIAAGAKIWAWASAIPFVGIGIALAGVAALTASALALRAVKLADGGIVTRPTMALIGEAGPEAVIPLNRAGGAGGISLARPSNGGQGGVNLTVNIGSWLGDREGAEKLVDTIMPLLRNRQRLSMGKADF